jgi:uncharacterized phiE125 gp8 family phage protein
MVLTEIAPAPELPVSAEQFKAHLRLGQGFPDDGSEDAPLQLYLANATAAVEAVTGKALVRRAFRLQVAGWGRDGRLALPIGPVVAVNAVTFVGPGAPVALPAGGWSLAPGTQRQVLSGTGGEALPAVPAGYVAELDFSAGFGDTGAAVPGELRQAVLLLAAHYYEERAGGPKAVPAMPAAVRSLLGAQRPVRL